MCLCVCKITVCTNTQYEMFTNSCAWLPVVHSEACKRFLSFINEYLTDGFLQFYGSSY